MVVSVLEGGSSYEADPAIKMHILAGINCKSWHSQRQKYEYIISSLRQTHFCVCWENLTCVCKQFFLLLWPQTRLPVTRDRNRATNMHWNMQKYGSKLCLGSREFTVELVLLWKASQAWFCWGLLILDIYKLFIFEDEELAPLYQFQWIKEMNRDTKHYCTR